VKSLSAREQGIFLVTIVLVAVYIGYQWLITPLRQRVADIERDIVSESRKIRQNRAALTEFQDLEGRYAELINVFAQQGSNEQVMARMLREIEKVASDLEMKISELKPQRARSGDYFNSFSVSLRMDSTLTAIIEFIDVLQSKPYGYRVQDIRFDKSPKRGSNEITTVVVLEKIFAVPPR
jgi:Tfp pilus assembly protein PilO